MDDTNSGVGAVCCHGSKTHTVRPTKSASVNGPNNHTVGASLSKQQKHSAVKHRTHHIECEEMNCQSETPLEEQKMQG